jgi:hypothetical protein
MIERAFPNLVIYTLNRRLVYGSLYVNSCMVETFESLVVKHVIISGSELSMWEIVCQIRPDSLRSFNRLSFGMYI